MATPFYDVFSNLKLHPDLDQIFSEVEILRVGRVQSKELLRIYIFSHRLIEKKRIFAVEREIKKQYFPGKDLKIKLMEKFQLSEQYTPKNLVSSYWDSILDEFRVYSMLEYDMLRTSRISFPEEDVIEFSMKDTLIARQKEAELYEILEKIFCGRCGMKVKITFDYYQEKENKFQKNAEILIKNRVTSIVRQTGLVRQREDLGTEPLQMESSSEVPFDGGTVVSARAEAGTGHSRQKTALKEEKTASVGGKKQEFGKKREFKDRGYFKRSDHPDVIYGRDFEEETIPIEQILGEMGEVCIRGKIIEYDSREIRNEKTIIMFAVSDFTDTIMVKMFCKNEYLPEITPNLKVGTFVKLKGVTAIDKYDSDLTIGSVIGIKKIPDFTVGRVDNSPQKRVELHCHTKMSDMDGVSDVQDIIGRADSWGHRAIAITDHGAVQAFPEANHAKLKNPDFKIIYGVEAYLVDDMKELVSRSRGQKLDDTYVVFDLETTGFSPNKNKIIEIGAVKVEGQKIVDRFSTFVNPQVPIPFEIEKLTSINDDMVLDAPVIETILPQFMEFCEGAVMVAHNADFDMSFIKHNCGLLHLPCEKTVVDTVALSRTLLPNLNRFKLDTVAKALNISLNHHHRAVDDAECTAEILLKLMEKLKSRGIEDLDRLNQLGNMSPETIKKLPTYHAIILATNDIGRVNLYRLVSDSHIKYYNKRPRIPKSEFVKYREGLLLGSACEAGELYRAILGGQSEEDIARIVKFYDYLEIQPLGNNAFMLRNGRDGVQSMEDIRNINRRIVKLGEAFKKMVVATCDVHFLDPEDEVYRRIIMAGKGFKDADDQAPLYLRTTEEMLEEFSYLGREKAEEIVIENPNKIADMVEKISPIHKGKCPPVIENSDAMLREICYNKAHEIYGEELPKMVEERLERELNAMCIFWIRRTKSTAGSSWLEKALKMPMTRRLCIFAPQRRCWRNFLISAVKKQKKW